MLPIAFHFEYTKGIKLILRLMLWILCKLALAFGVSSITWQYYSYMVLRQKLEIGKVTYSIMFQSIIRNVDKLQNCVIDRGIYLVITVVLC